MSDKCLRMQEISLMFAPDLISNSFTSIFSRREIEFGRTDNAEPPPDIKNKTKSFFPV